MRVCFTNYIHNKASSTYSRTETLIRELETTCKLHHITVWKGVMTGILFSCVSYFLHPSLPDDDNLLLPSNVVCYL